MSRIAELLRCITGLVFWPDYDVSSDERGFTTLRDGKPAGRVEWASIRRIEAFKKDQITVDLVCFAVTYTEVDQPLAVEVNEDMPGFADLERRLVANLPGFMTDWRTSVIKPAFALNWTVIYERE
jgi:hypothetical protein